MYGDGHLRGGSNKRKKADGGVWYGKRRTIARSSGSAKDWIDLYGSNVSVSVSVCDGIVVFNEGATHE